MINSRQAVGGFFFALAILVIAQLLSQLVASIFVFLRLPMGICNIMAGILYLGLSFTFLILLIEKVFKQEAADFGMPKLKILPKWLLVAIVLPVCVKGSYLLCFTGEYVSSKMSGKDIFSTLSAGIVFTGIAAGFVEEMVFRGVVFNLFKKSWNIKAAILLPSFIFAFVHLLGMDFSFGSSLLVLLSGTMVGIMFSLIAIESGSLWNSGIVHAIWNIVMIGGGLAIGNQVDEYSLMTYVIPTKSFVITGGEFGVESSIIALIGYIIVSIMAFVMIIKKEKHKT